MDYVQEMLLAQAELAAQLGGQTSLRLRQSIRIRRRQQEPEQTQKTEQRHDTVNTADGSEAAVSALHDDAPEEQLHAALRALEQSTARASSLAAQRQERLLRQTQQTQSVSVPLSTPSRWGGGVVGELSQTMEASGLAGRQTRYAMSEISRFFERDARRYGG